MVCLQSVISFIVAQQYHFINASLTWYEAQSFCRVKYSDLATVNSMGDNNQLVHTLGSHVTHSWIGLLRGKTGRWMWSDGRGAAHFTKWQDDEPNNSGGNEWCAETSPTGSWNDVQCEEGTGFACYDLQQDGKQRYVFYLARGSWESSQELCRRDHIDLAYVSTEGNHSEIAKQTEKFSKSMWIGLFNDAWMWSDGRQTSFRYWLRGSHHRGDCASVAVSQQGRWGEANCNEKAPFVCHGGLKERKIIIRMTVRSDVDLTDSTLNDALLEKLEMGLRQRKMTDFNLSWRSDNSGRVFRRREDAEKKEDMS
ncbi:macrophage mannose receptor 1-like [Cottoperca gobio]|uniref:Macrophage mannose receptor 1-like n=1 Tax=Cottoperca gobio TaxID=56716 RepID=A0A6J2RPP2_COTGO|nr:macrophage mannose receptor 1-like [Cottoperca gobio]